MCKDLEEVGLLEPGVHLVIHTGQDYYGELLPKLRDIEDVSIESPTKGFLSGRRFRGTRVGDIDTADLRLSYCRTAICLENL